MSLNTNYCRLCLQKIEGPAKTLSKNWDIAKQVTSLFPSVDTSLVVNSKLCVECCKYVRFSSLMVEKVTKNEQKILDQNTQLFEKITCRLCLNNETLEEVVCLFKNTNQAARYVIKIAISDLNFDTFSKPVMCNSCWKAVKSIYLFKKKCFATEKILKYYCATNKINSLDKKELEMVSLSYHEKLQQFSENLDEDVLFDRKARCTGNSNLTQNVVSPKGMYFNSYPEDKNNVFEEAPNILNTLNVHSESLKEEGEIEFKEEKLCEFEESDENVYRAANSLNLESIGRIQHTEINPNVAEIPIIKSENVENICHSIKFPTEPGVDTKETIHSSNDDVLKMQLSVVKEEQFLFCGKCDYQTKNKIELNKHYLLHDKNAELFNCSNSSSKNRNLQSHLRSHDPDHKTQLSLKKEKCPYETSEDFDSDFCLKSCQSKKKILKCSECYYITTRHNYLKNHMKTHQTKSRTFQCQKCDYVARWHSNLRIHMLIHQNNYNFRCHKCSYRGKTKKGLVDHKIMHQDNYDFQCYNCNYQARRKSHLISHMLIHQDNYNFKCHICSHQSKSRSHLALHMIVHEENRNFPCHKCSYRAKRKSSLMCHMSVHQDNYNFQCYDCGYQAKKKTHLARHMLRHR